MSSSSPGFSGVRVSQSVVFCTRFCVLFAIVMPALLLFTASDYPFGICKHSKRFVRFSLLQFLLSLFLCCCCCCWYLSSFCLSDIYHISVFLIFIIFLSFWYLSSFCLSDIYHLSVFLIFIIFLSFYTELLFFISSWYLLPFLFKSNILSWNAVQNVLCFLSYK